MQRGAAGARLEGQVAQGSRHRQVDRVVRARLAYADHAVLLIRDGVATEVNRDVSRLAPMQVHAVESRLQQLLEFLQYGCPVGAADLEFLVGVRDFRSDLAGESLPDSPGKVFCEGRLLATDPVYDCDGDFLGGHVGGPPLFRRR